MSNTIKHVSPIETAHFRFALVAPVVQGLFPDASASEYYRRVTEKPILRPDGTTYLYNPRTLEKWGQLYQKGGMDALMPQERSDKGITRTLSDEAICEIINLKEKFPKINATMIHRILIQEGFIPAVVSVAAVQRFIKKNNLKVFVDPNVKERLAFEEPEFGCTWQVDTCYLPHIKEDGKSRRTFLIAIVDDHSRLCVGAQIFYNDNAYNFQKLFKQAVSTYGIPDKIYCDHGSNYIDEQLKLICGSLGCLKLHAPVRDGAAKAKIERSFRSIKERWLYALDLSQIDSLAAFNESLAEYIRRHNTAFHKGIKETPMDRFLRTKDHIRKPKSAEWVDECFQNRITRKVKKDSTISIDNISYDIPQQFIGSKVEVRYLPDRMSAAYVLYNDKHYPIHVTDKNANSRVRRKNLPVIDYSMRGSAANE